MKRLACLLLLLPALPARAEPLRLHAAVEAGDLHLEADAPLPASAFIRVQVFRDVTTFSKQPPVPLADVRVPFTSPDHLETLLPMGEALAVPGHYRVRAEFERHVQYPAVLERIGELVLDPVETFLVVGMDSESFLAKILKEQAYLEDALSRTEGFLTGLQALQAPLPPPPNGVEADPAAHVKAWQDWWTQARPFFESLILHGREEMERCYPETHQAFTEEFIFYGIFRDAALAHHKATTSTPAHPSLDTLSKLTGDLKAPRHGTPNPKPPAEALLRCRALLSRETLHYRLAGADTLIRAVRTETASQRNTPDRARWFRRRALWGRHHELLGTGLQTLPQREALAVLLKAVTAWIDAEEKTLFEQAPPAQPAEIAVREALVPLRKALLETGKP